MSEILKEHEALRALEQSRLAALVAGDVEAARLLHADDFQLVTPVGMVLAREQYLGAIAAGALCYKVWEPKEMEVRLFGQGAAIRYQSELEVTFGQHHMPRATHWHTDLYEKRNGVWQLVWSHATAVRSMV